MTTPAATDDVGAWVASELAIARALTLEAAARLDRLQRALDAMKAQRPPLRVVAP